MIRWNSKNHLPNIRKNTPRVCFISLEYDSKTLESVQAKATLTKESHHLPYEMRLERLGLTDLKTRQERGDFIKIYKIVHGLEKVKWCDENRILRSEQNITGLRHPFQLSLEQTSGNETRTHFLLNRMATHGTICVKTLHLHTRWTLSRASLTCTWTR